MIHSWMKALLEGAFGVVERGGKTATEIDEEQQAKFVELAVTNGTGGFGGPTGATVLP
jgi:transposase